MSILSALRVALAALLVHKGRSILTSLGILIGISSVIAMVSAGSGAFNMLDNRLESVGKNLIIVRGGARTQQGVAADFVPVTTDDCRAIRKRVGPLLIDRRAAVSQIAQRLVASRTGSHTTTLVGTEPDLPVIRNWKSVVGRFFTEEEVQRQAPVCVIGQTIQKKLFQGKSDPRGEFVRIGHVQLRVIGVLEEKGRNPLGADQDDQVFMPVTTLQQKIVGEKKIGLIITAARTEELLDRAKDEIIKVLRERHRIKPDGQDDFDVSTVREMAELAVILTRVMQILISIIASISLVVGGIGIMNIMLVSVTERTREIGIRMAVGATPGDVLIQFLIEAVVLSLVGGLLGIALGLGGAIALARLAQWPIMVNPAIVALAFAVAAGVGIFFGYYPALKASRLDPIEALRYE